MTAAYVSNLDIEKFRKLRSLMLDGATEGERNAGRLAATNMAKRAGLTFEQAVSKMDAAQPVKPKGIFDGFDDWCEAREPGYKAKQAEEKAVKETMRAAERRRLLDKHGSEEAVFAETEHERLLRDALEPLADRQAYGVGEGSYVAGFAGWRHGKPSAEVWAAIERAYPLPTSLSDVWREFLEWEELDQARYAFDENGGPSIYVRARTSALEDLLDTMPAPTWEGVEARIAWLNHSMNSETSRDAKEDQALVRTLAADFEALKAGAGNRQEARSPKSGTGNRRTNADKRRDVLAMLEAEPGLPDREIGRRCGVSPQTVGNWRKRKSD